MAFLGSCILCLIPFSLLFGLCFSWAEVAEFKLELSYITRSPLGVPQQVIAVNGSFPGPVLNVTTNYIVNVTVTNKLDEILLITWHGLKMRRASWKDGVLGSNFPIPPNSSWTYEFQVKDQIGSFFYFPSLNLQRSAGGFGSFIISNNMSEVPLPFDIPYDDIVVFIGDWYKQSHKALRGALDNGTDLGIPDGVLINGKGPYSMAEPSDYEKIKVVPGKTYRIRVHNVGVSTCLNFQILKHDLLLVETEGRYMAQQYNSSLDIHVGQSYTFLVTMNQSADSDYYIVASPKFVNPNQYQNVIGVAILYYSNLKGKAAGPLPTNPNGVYNTSLAMEQSMSIRQDLNVNANGRSPQGNFEYHLLNSSTERFILRSTQPSTIDGKLRATFNGISFKNPGYPIPLLDQFDKSKDVYNLDFPNATLPSRPPRISTSLINGTYKSSMELILQNNDTVVLSFHMDGHSFFVLGMGLGEWTINSTELYNWKDAICRSTVQVFPGGWTTVLIYLDNIGIWNLRAENLDRWYLGQETYIRVVDPFENSTNPKSSISIARGVGHPKLYLTLLVVFSASISILC